MRNRFTKIIALLLCAAMMMCVFTGCAEEAVNTTEEASARDFDAGRAAYAADEVVMTLEGEDLTWDEFYNWICYALANYQYTYGPVSDFSTATALGNMSDAIIQEACDYIVMYKAVEKKAAELGIDLPADMEQQIEEDWDASLDSFERDEEALMEYIKEYYGSRELYEYTFKYNSISPDLFEYFVGADGEKLTAAQIEEGSEGYLMAKHILVQTTYEDTGLVLEEDDMKAAQERIETAYALLEAYEGDDLEGYFDELTAQYTEDTGYAAYPDGYLFQEGDMVTEFYDAVNGIEIGQFSEVVESTYGYHIVFRLPVDAEAVPMQYASYGYNISLRSIIANDLLSEETRAWREEVEYTTTELYDSIDLAQLF